MLNNHMTINFKITNLTCGACVKLSEMALKKIPGVSAVKVDLATGAASIDSTAPIDWSAIVDTLQKIEKNVTQL